jgi:hypothetical protein
VETSTTMCRCSMCRMYDGRMFRRLMHSTRPHSLLISYSSLSSKSSNVTRVSRFKMAIRNGLNATPTDNVRRNVSPQRANRYGFPSCPMIKACVFPLCWSACNSRICILCGCSASLCRLTIVAFEKSRFISALHRVGVGCFD